MQKTLIIEDSDAMRAHLEMLLNELDIPCVSTSNGHDAIRAVSDRGPFDLLITDIFMPEMDGLEAIEAIRSRYPAIKVIAISGGGMGMSGRAMLDIATGLGAQRTLPKPFQPEELKTAVLETLAS